MNRGPGLQGAVLFLLGMAFAGVLQALAECRTLKHSAGKAHAEAACR